MRLFRFILPVFLSLAFLAGPVMAAPQKPIHMLVRSVWPLKEGIVVDCQLYLWTDDGPLSFEQMKEVQGSKLHLILMSPDYDHFYHANPIATGEGEFRFTIQAAKKEPLRIWAIFTNENGRQVVTADLNNEPITEFKPLDPDVQIIQGQTDAVIFTLHFPRQIRANVPIDGMIYATLKNSKVPFTELESMHGSYAYFDAMSDDFKTLSEIHPTDAPAKDGVYGGPAVHFRLLPAKAGMMRIVAELQARGNDMLVPFTVRVAPAFPKPPHVPDSDDPDQIPSPPPDAKMGE